MDLRNNRLTLAAIAAASCLGLCATGAAFAEEKSLSEQLVGAFNTLAGGPHEGYRANHAKGVLATGTFTPTDVAPSLSKAAHLQGTVPVTVRFSNATGVPVIPDADPNASPHGMAIRFQLADGSYTDIVAISANGFPVKTPEDLLALLTAVAKSGPDAPKPSPIEQFLGSHPETVKFVTTPKPAPASFATLPFYGVNAFKFTNAQGVSEYGRYQILPVAGDQRLSDKAVAEKGPNYLMEELPARLAREPVQFRLIVQLAKKGDSLTDPTSVWPDDRAQVDLGLITLTAPVANDAQAQKALMFNPLTLTDGIEASADPILLARPGAYAVSIGQRLK
ncbi:MAG TPA: catalase family peroxidase [Burkholderiales bacterium]|nr:catalase family peroxidase [Burkholderiales bacterium]